MLVKFTSAREQYSSLGIEFENTIPVSGIRCGLGLFVLFELRNTIEKKLTEIRIVAFLGELRKQIARLRPIACLVACQYRVSHLAGRPDLANDVDSV